MPFRLPQRFCVKNQVRKSALHIRQVYVPACGALLADLPHIAVESYGSGADVMTLGKEIDCPRLALGSDGDLRDRTDHAGRLAAMARTKRSVQFVRHAITDAKLF